MRKKRTYNLNKIKTTRSYTCQQIADLFDITLHTVHMWVRDGELNMTNKKPYLIHGSKLHEYLKRKQFKRKVKCAVHEMFCLGCKAPSIPQEPVKTKEISETRLMLKGVCPKCEARINRIIDRMQLPFYKRIFSIVPSMPARSRSRTRSRDIIVLSDTTNPTLNQQSNNFKKETKND